MIPPVGEKTFPVGVTNGWNREIVGHYDGQRYAFAPKKINIVPSNVARHIFGYGLADKLPAILRLGWSKTGNDLDEMFERLSRVTFDPPEERFTSEQGEQTSMSASKPDSAGKMLTA